MTEVLHVVHNNIFRDYLHACESSRSHTLTEFFLHLWGMVYCIIHALAVGAGTFIMFNTIFLQSYSVVPNNPMVIMYSVYYLNSPHVYYLSRY